ncbi:hypothetical protein [Streptomyces sp. NPDC002588]|uniref:hypothetical protein n=1 Tax=Streptomyces sp. NPDC002588 TaxID=3154419 RepID=UPI003319A40A
MTVQLDTPHPAGGGGPGASDAPVFVDESGRRSRTFRRIGMLVGLACGAYAVVIVATLLSGHAGAPWLPVPGQDDDDPPAGRVETSRAPSASATATTGSPGFAAPRGPGVSASAGGPARPGERTGPDASKSAEAPADGSARPSPSGSAGTGSSPEPSTSASADGPTSPVVGVPPTTPPPASSPTASPSDGPSPVTSGAPGA